MNFTHVKIHDPNVSATCPIGFQPIRNSWEECIDLYYNPRTISDKRVYITSGIALHPNGCFFKEGHRGIYFNYGSGGHATQGDIIVCKSGKLLHN